MDSCRFTEYRLSQILNPRIVVDFQFTFFRLNLLFQNFGNADFIANHPNFLFRNFFKCFCF